ncbi:MAG: tetratricopeptide repeat protein [Candidatus Krumholzibacteriia bacterium]
MNTVVKRSLLVPATLCLLLASGGAPGPVSAQPADPPAPAADPVSDVCARGEDLYRAGRFAEARTALKDCLEQGGEAVEVLLPLAVMGLREGRLEEAEEFGQRAVAVAPQDPEARYWYGRCLLRSGRVEEARGQWESGLQVDMTHKGILEGLARLSIQDGDPAKAYNLLNQIRQQGLDESWLHRLMADLAASKGMWAQSRGHLMDAMARDGANAADLLSASELSILGGEPQAAVGYCRQAVLLEPGPPTFGGLGEAYFATDSLDSALVYLRLATEDDQGDPRFVFNLANALEVAGLYEEAGVQFERFLTRVPDDAVGHFNYGIHLDRMGRTAAAIDHVSRAIDLDATMLSARVVLAQMKENAGDIPGALAVVGELKRLDPDNTNELNLWEERLAGKRGRLQEAQAAGKIHLLHMVLPTAEAVDLVRQELEAGADFASLAVRFSTGAGAAKGGDIGWIRPGDMIEPLRSAISDLEINETSPPVEAGGLYHLFKRVP